MSKKQTKKPISTTKAPMKATKTGGAMSKPRARTKTTTTPASGGAGTSAAAADESMTTAPRGPEQRLPPPGTVIEKKDRYGNVRCKCTVEATGIRYNRHEFRSLSAAAMAAAKDLGLKNKTQNGFTFWGLSKPPRPPGDAVTALQRWWERYHGKVAALVRDGVTDENRAHVAAAIRKHGEVLAALREEVG